MNKAELRKSLISARKKDKNRDIKDSNIFKKLLSNEIFADVKIILSYISVKDEIDTRKLINYCFLTGKKIALPKVENKKISFFYINSLHDLKIGSYGIPEPLGSCERLSDFDFSVCVTPALAFNKQSYRLGYGGGYYDRFLKDYPGISIGLCYSENILEFPIEEHDIPVDFVITGG